MGVDIQNSISPEIFKQLSGTNRALNSLFDKTFASNELATQLTNSFQNTMGKS
jgi:hypothetical protein